MQTYKRRLSFSQLLNSGNQGQDIFNYLPPVKDYFFTESVRGGLEALIDILLAGQKGKVLLPVFIAEGAISPFKNKNIPIIFYKLRQDLSPDMNDIKEKIVINPEIRIILVIHYFGFAQNLKYLKEFCVKHKYILLEDCVHALFSKDENKNYLGMTGDISFFSLSKILPVPDGGIFFINNPEFVQIISKINYRKSITGYLMIRIHLIYLIIKSFEVGMNDSIAYRLLNLSTKALYFIYYVFLKQARKPQYISSQTLKILKNINYEHLIVQRKLHIKKLYEALANVNHILLKKEYNPNWMLTGIPLISKHRKQITSSLRRNNIECLSYNKSWFYMPNGMEQEFNIEYNFHKYHFLLPVHEDTMDYTEILNKKVFIDNFISQ